MKDKKNSFKLILTLFQLIRRHKGINKVVNSMKNNEIPSTPRTKFKLNIEIHKDFVVY